jgi:hypothetical protein
MRRIVDLEQGRVMVVTDLHGHLPAYRRYRDRFLALRAEGQADVLLFCGDLIHGDGPPEADGSLDIMLDLLRLRGELGERLIVLLGNHELPHLYGITISKGSMVYGPHFEKAMGAHRPDIIAFLDSLPLYVRTRAGVSVAHAGACRAATTLDGLHTLAHYAHADERARVDAWMVSYNRASLRAGLEKLTGESYAHMVAENLGLTDPGDPRYDDVLRGALMTSLSPNFSLLWEATFNKNEHEYGREAYLHLVTGCLASLSHEYAPQHVLVSGHIVVEGGYAVVAHHQLRLASWTHASPPEAGQYLLFDAARPIHGVDDLLAGLHAPFEAT